MKQRLKKIRGIFLFFFLLSGGIVSADLDPALRENFSKFTSDLCHSAISYDLDESFVDKKLEYHATQNCLMNDALGIFSAEIFEEMRQAVDPDTARENLIRTIPTFQSPEAETCAGKSLGTIQTQQKRYGFTSLCEDQGENSAKIFSACRVSETLLTEWCGYQMFATAKIEDFQSIKTEYQNQIGNRSDATKVLSAVEISYQKELDQSHRSLRQTLAWYQGLTESYRSFVWFRGLQAETARVMERFGKFRDAILTWPDKFINASET